jgi:hypothetical protein
MNWVGNLPRRRYAFFRSVFAPNPEGLYLIVVRGADIERAEKWGGFVKWCGGEHKQETRETKKRSITTAST